jgi:hypothetical protein
MTKHPVLNLWLVSTVFLAVCATAEPYWATSYGGSSEDRGRSLQQTADGGFILTGSTNSWESRGHDVLVLKLDGEGAVQWQRTYGGIVEDGSANDYASSIQQTMDDGYIVAGSTDGSMIAFVAFWVLKLDALGNVTWQKVYSHTGWDSARSIRQASDGGYVVLGTAGISGEDYWLLRLDSVGEIEWQKTYGRSSRDFAAQIQETVGGGYILAGSSEGTSGNFWYWVMKLDEVGAIEWEKAYWERGDSRVSSIQQTVDGGYVLAGNKEVGDADSDCWILKLDGFGEIEWEKAYGGNMGDGCYGVQQTGEGGYILVGSTASFGAGDTDVWVLKMDGLGEIEWQYAYGGNGRDFAYSVQEPVEHGYIVAANTDSFGAGGYDLWVLKLDSQGVIPFCCLVTPGSAEVKHDINLQISTEATVLSPDALVSAVDLFVSSPSPTVTDTCEGSCEGWGPACQVEMESGASSKVLDPLLMMIGPFGFVLLWQRYRSRSSKTNRFIQSGQATAKPRRASS